jgi:hypothetical protein
MQTGIELFTNIYKQTTDDSGANADDDDGDNDDSGSDYE